MPVMGGYEATRQIRRLDRTDARSIPIIALTANAFAEDIQHAMDAGMNAHVAKPLNIKTIKKIKLHYKNRMSYLIICLDIGQRDWMNQ